MEELIAFDTNEDRIMGAGLIAIILVILQVWISSGVHDPASLISLIAFSISLPMLAFNLLITHNSLLFSKIDRYLDDYSEETFDPPFKPIKTKKMHIFIHTNKTIGMILAAIGILAAIWHASWIAGLIFLIIGIISLFIYIEVSPDREDLLRVAFALGNKEAQDLQKEIDELKKKNEEEFLKDFYSFD